jgi:hypothetical protein
MCLFLFVLILTSCKRHHTCYCEGVGVPSQKREIDLGKSTKKKAADDCKGFEVFYGGPYGMASCTVK